MRLRMQRVLFMVMILSLPVGVGAAESGGGKESLLHRMQSAIHGLRVDAVQPSPIAGLYEIVSGRNIYYSDLDGRHLIAGGHIFDTSSRRDLTASRLQE
ncbi:MAG: disulfide isomerase DsbC N-terminal domain-containing protein, partial [Mariprofundales bacterium]|nr:disulfide isomerase DsbC N-terminal domain-containing protein [Mariprofundales bacterium]